MRWVEVNLTLYIKEDGTEVRYSPSGAYRKGVENIWADRDGLPDLDRPLDVSDEEYTKISDKAWEDTSVGGVVASVADTPWKPLDEDNGPEFGW